MSSASENTSVFRTVRPCDRAGLTLRLGVVIFWAVKIKISPETVKKVAELSKTFDASMEDFLNALPTPEKYEIVALAWSVRTGKDFEDRHCEATHSILAQQLTSYLLNYSTDGYPSLYEHLTDAVSLGWVHFEIPIVDEDEEEEEENARIA